MIATYNPNNPTLAKNYREVTVFSATEYYKEIHRAQRGWKTATWAEPETDNSCRVIKDGKIVARITITIKN